MERSIEFNSHRKPLQDMLLYQKISNLKALKKNRKDELALLLLLTFKPLEWKLVIIVIIYVACQFTFASCLTIYRILSTFDEHVVLKHGSFGGIEVFVSLNFWTVVFKYREISSFVHTLKKTVIPLDKEVLGEERYKSVKYKIKLVKIVILLNYTLAMAAAFAFTVSPEYFNSRKYLAVWIRENFRDHAEYILFVLNMSNFPVAATLVSLSTALAYCSLTSLFQIVLVNENIAAICKTDIPPSQRYNSEIYQMMVCQKLKIYIIWHGIAIKLTEIAANMLYATIILLSIGAIVLGGSLLLEFFTNDVTEMSNQYFAIVCFSIAGVISSGLYVTPGQLIKDESERMYYLLTHLPWYYMNKQNKQIYSIILTRAVIPLSLTNNLFEVNFLLLVRLFRAIYSMAALLARFVTTIPSRTMQ